jgi:hypothetical protein
MVAHYQRVVPWLLPHVAGTPLIAALYPRGLDLDKAAASLNVSRQAVINTLLRQALDQHYLAEAARRS